MIHSKHSQDRSYFRRERKSLSHYVLAFPLKSAQATKVSVPLNCWFQMIDIYFLFLGGGRGEGVSVGSHYRLHTSCNIFFFLLFWSCIFFLFPLRACWNGSIVISWWIACFAQHDPARSARTIYDYHTTRCMLFISYYFITRYIFFCYHL